MGWIKDYNGLQWDGMRTGIQCKGDARVMQRRYKKKSQKRLALIKTFILGFILALALATPVGGIEHWSQLSQPCQRTIRPRRRLIVTPRTMYVSRLYKYNETDINGGKWR